MKFKCASILCHVECLTLEKGAQRCSETPPLALCQSTRPNIPGDLNRRYYRCETLDVSLVSTFSFPIASKSVSVAILFVLYNIQKWFVRARSLSEIRHSSCTSVCWPKSMAHKHTADSTKQALAYSLWIKPTDALHSNFSGNYYSTCFGQSFCPSSGVLSRTSVLVHFCSCDEPFATRSRMALPTYGSELLRMGRRTARNM